MDFATPPSPLKGGIFRQHPKVAKIQTMDFPTVELGEHTKFNSLLEWQKWELRGGGKWNPAVRIWFKLSKDS